MKHSYVIAALILATAFLTPAHATSIILSTTLPTGTLGTSANLYLSNSTYTGNTNGYIVATGYDNFFLDNNVVNNPNVSYAHSHQLDVANEVNNGTTKGLGINNTGDPYIGPSDAIVLDFSHVNTSIGGQGETSVSFSLYRDILGPSAWVVYGVNSSGVTLITQGQMQGTGISVGPITPTISTSTLYSSYIIGITSDCSIDINSVSVTYNGKVPEPGTFLMAGIALIGVGVAIKKRRQKA